MHIKRNESKSYQKITVELGLYAFALLCFFFISRSIFSVNKKMPDSYLMAIYIPIFVISIVGMGLFLFYDYKFNELNINIAFIVIAASIAISNIISISCLPSVVSLPFGASINISTSDRIYSLMFGFILGILPLLAFYVLPRKLRHKEYIEWLLI